MKNNWCCQLFQGNLLRKFPCDEIC